MDVAFNQIITRWAWVAIAVFGILLSYCVILKLHESGIYPIREATKIIRRPWFETALLLFIVGGLIQYGATKGTNGTAGVNRPGLMQRSDLQLDDADGFEGTMEESFAITNLCFTRIAPLSNSVCLSVAWPTNTFVEGTTLDFFAKVNALTNLWTWLEAHDTVPSATNLEVEIARPILAPSTNVPAVMFFRVQDRNTCATTMRDADQDGIPDVYELHNGTNPYVPDSESAPRLTVGRNGDYASVEAALADSTAYSVISLGGETFMQSAPVVMPSHPVLIEGPKSGYAVIRSDAEVGAVKLTDGQDAQTMFRNLIVDLCARKSFQAGFWVGGGTPWTGRGAAATFENVRVRANYPGVEHYGWLFYRDGGCSSILRKCVMNAAGSTWAYGVSSFNAASNVIDDCAFLNLPTNSLEESAIAVMSRESTNVVVEVRPPEARPDLSWAGYPYAGSYSQTADSDGDGISDYDEIFRTNTDPWLADSDGDEISDGVECNDGTDPRNLNSHDYLLVVSVTNADMLVDVTNYVFVGTGGSQWGDMVYSCHDEGGSTNFTWKISDGALLVSSFRDLNRNGIFDSDYDVVLSNRVSGLQTVVNLTFPFGDVDGDGVGDLQERLDETDPYSVTSLKISRTVRISNADGDSAITNYCAISQTRDSDGVQWTRMSSDALSFVVSQKTTTGCLYALVYRDFNKNGVYDEGVDALYDWNRFVSDSTVFDVTVGDFDGDTISDGTEVREGTDPLNNGSYCYQVSARITGVFSTTNQLTCSASFGTNEIMAATVVTNTELALSFGHQATTNGEFVTLWFWDDANSNSVKDVEETCASTVIKPDGHEVVYEGKLPTSAFDMDRDGLMDWWEARTGLSALEESHGETDDNDRDGLINLHEYWAGTDPLTPDGSNTLLSVCARSVDDRLAGINLTNDVCRFIDFFRNASNEVFVVNTNLWCRDVDLSCVSVWHQDEFSKNETRGTMTATAITRRHILVSNHWYSNQYRFCDTNGNVVVREHDRTRRIYGDTYLARLTVPLPTSVVPAKLLSAGYAEYIRDGKYLPSVCVNENQQVMVGELEDLDTCVNGFQHYGKVSSTNIVTESRESIRGSISIGQSSSPVFLLVEGTPVLLLIKHLGYQDALQWNPTWGPTLSHYVNIIQQEIDSWEGAGTYRLDMINLANFEGIMPGRE